MEMNDNTILRIKVPAHLYEAVKAQLTLGEAKQNFGTKDMKPVKGQKATGGSSDKPKKAAAPKAEKMEVPKDGHEKAAAPKTEAEAQKEKKKPTVEEIKKMYEFLGSMLAEMEKEAAPVEEAKEEKVEEAKEEKVEETKWGGEHVDEPDYDEDRGRFVKYTPKKQWRPKYVPKGNPTTSTAGLGRSSYSKVDPTWDKDDPRRGF